MKPIAISSYLVFAALSLYAAEPQATKENPAPLASHTPTLLSAPATGIGDSPLVRAAKATAASRLGKKPAQVITNETLVREGGHFTTTTAAAQALLPAGTRESTDRTFDQMAADVRRARADAAAAAEQYRKTAEQKRIADGRAAARAEGDSPEGLYADPPTVATSQIPTMKPTGAYSLQAPPAQAIPTVGSGQVPTVNAVDPRSMQTTEPKPPQPPQ